MILGMFCRCFSCLQTYYTREKEKIKEKENISYQQIADLYNSLCPSYPSIRSLSEARKKAIRARLRTYTVDDFRMLFKKAEASNFLKGGNDRNWSATFDWLVKDANMAKVLDGNYDNKGVKHNGSAERNSKSAWGQLGKVL